jgi:hypothetical protein
MYTIINILYTNIGLYTGRWCICALGWREPSLVLRTPVAS